MIEIKKGDLKKLPGKIKTQKLDTVDQIFAEQEKGSLPKRLFSLEEKDIEKNLPKRSDYSHKGSFGKLLVIAGSKNMAGASYLAGKAAYRIGCGLVKIMTPEENRIILQTALPEAILSCYNDTLSEVDIDREIEWADAIAMGPGLGQEALAEKIVCRVLSRAKCPLVLDADGLNLSAKHMDLLKAYPYNEEFACPNLIVTPHFGEMMRLTGWSIPKISGSCFTTARDFAQEHSLICHLKHAASVTALPDGDIYINMTGNGGMATAGSGDVLTGIIGGLLAQHSDPAKAAVMGAYIHGDSGDKMAKRLGRRALMASDLILGLTQLEYLK